MRITNVKLNYPNTSLHCVNSIWVVRWQCKNVRWNPDFNGKESHQSEREREKEKKCHFLVRLILLVFTLIIFITSHFFDHIHSSSNKNGSGCLWRPPLDSTLAEAQTNTHTHTQHHLIFLNVFHISSYFMYYLLFNKANQMKPSLLRSKIQSATDPKRERM